MRGKLFLDANHLARVPVRELERFDEIGLRHFVRRAFNHDDVVFGADVNKIEIALRALRVCGVGDELAIDAADAHGADRARKRNVGNAKRGRSAIKRENIRIIFTIRAEKEADDLRVVEVSRRKEWPQRPIDHA